MSLLLYIALVPALGVLAQWIAWRTRLPGIVLLLGFGIGLGQFVSPDRLLAEAIEGDPAAGPQILFPLVSLAVAVVLFEGGLSLRLRELRDAGGAVLRLVTLAALVTMVGSAVAAHYLLGFHPRVALLLGAIMTVTGPTVIAPLLRQIRPPRRVESTLRWESIVIDPIGAVLAVLVFEQLLAQRAGVSFWSGSLLLLETTAVGCLSGAIAALLLVQGLRRFWIPDHLHGVTALSGTLAIYALSNQVADESGLIAVTVLGVLLANQKQAAIEHIVEFKEHLGSLLIGCLFIVLGSRLDLAAIGALGFPGLGMVAAMILVVRPVSVALATWRTPLPWRERLFVAGMAPRGIVAAAVASVFALKLEKLGVAGEMAGASELATLTFLIILGTVTWYGLTGGLLAHALGLSQAGIRGFVFVGADPWVREIARVLHQQGVPLLMVDTNYRKITLARMESIPAECVNILGDRARELVGLGGAARLLAMTPNDEVNSLAVHEFGPLLGRADVFQLAHRLSSSHDRWGLPNHLSGRTLFGPEATFSRLSEMFEQGAQVKATLLSDTFTYEDFSELYGDRALLLFAIESDQRVRVNSTDRPLHPVSGQRIIALVPPLEADA